LLYPLVIFQCHIVSTTTYLVSNTDNLNILFIMIRIQIVYQCQQNSFCSVFSITCLQFCRFLFVCLMVFNATFNNISVILVEETRKRRKLLTCHKSLTNPYHIMLYISPWSRFELTTSVVIDTDCIGSCKSNYHTITATTASKCFVGVIYCILNILQHHTKKKETFYYKMVQRFQRRILLK
jgi:hypothetical protein